jgi:hypothetical protein
LEESEDLQQAIQRYIWAKVAKDRDTDVKRKAKAFAKKIMKKFIVAVNEELTNNFDF